MLVAAAGVATVAVAAVAVVAAGVSAVREADHQTTTTIAKARGPASSATSTARLGRGESCGEGRTSSRGAVTAGRGTGGIGGAGDTATTGSGVGAGSGGGTALGRGGTSISEDEGRALPGTSKATIGVGGATTTRVPVVGAAGATSLGGATPDSVGRRPRNDGSGGGFTASGGISGGATPGSGGRGVGAFDGIGSGLIESATTSLSGGGSTPDTSRAFSSSPFSSASRLARMASPCVPRTRPATFVGGASFGPATRRSSAARAAAEANLFSGSAASAPATMSASGAAQGTPAGMIGLATLPLSRCVTIAEGCVFGNSARPLSASQSITPTLYTSAFGPVDSSASSTSGAR